MREICKGGVALPSFEWSPWWTNAVLMGVQVGAAFGTAFVKAAGLAAVDAAVDTDGVPAGEEWRVRIVAALVREGNAAFQNGALEQSLQLFVEAESAFRPSGAIPAALYTNRAAVLERLGRFEDALADAGAAIRLRSEWSRGYSLRGRALFGLERYGEAKVAYERALALEPDNTAISKAFELVEASLSWLG